MDRQPSQTTLVPSPGADMLLFNARITTQNLAQPEASALAVKGGRVYAVGSDADVLSLKGNNTTVIDAEGRRLIPGINDSHTHLINEKASNYNVKWDGVPTLTRALEMLSEQAKRTPKGQWVKVIGGWSPHQFSERRMPTLDELKTAVPDRPFIVQYAYNQAFLNDLAMKELGVGTPRFPVLPRADFEKDSHGQYTGVAYGDTVLFLVLETLVPQPTFDEQKNALLQVINNLNRFGVTSVIDAAGFNAFPQGHAPLQALIQDNQLNIRISFLDVRFPSNATISPTEAEIDSITRKNPLSPGQNLYPDMKHGYEYEGMGEALRIELHDHENFDRPAIIIDKDTMDRYIRKDIPELIKRRIPFRMHITYRENISSFLDALEKVIQQVPLDGLRWGIEHAEFISAEDMERVKRLGGGVTFEGKMAVHGDGFIKTYSREKALQTPPFRLMLEKGVPLALSTDGFRAASYNPWTTIAWAVTGKSVSGSEVLGEQNRLTREEALRLFTLGSAWFEYDEHERGRIAPGNLADFALLDADYFGVPEDEIKGIRSVLTVVDGRVVFGTGKYNNLAPTLSPVIPEWSPVKYFGGYYNTM
jgi:predicted amidohydrolase YtcJ